MTRRGANGLIGVLVLGGWGTLAEPAVAQAQAPPFTYDRSHRTGTRLMRDILVADGTLEGARVTDFRLDDRCTTTIVTARGSTTIKWSKVSDIVSRDSAGRRIMRIDRDGPPVLVSVADRGATPAGDAALQLEAGCGLLADVCGS